MCLLCARYAQKAALNFGNRAANIQNKIIFSIISLKYINSSKGWGSEYFRNIKSQNTQYVRKNVIAIILLSNN